MASHFCNNRKSSRHQGCGSVTLPPPPSPRIASFNRIPALPARSVQERQQAENNALSPPAGKRASFEPNIDTEPTRGRDAGSGNAPLAVSRGSIIGCNVPIARSRSGRRARDKLLARGVDGIGGAGKVDGSARDKAACANRSWPLANWTRRGREHRVEPSSPFPSWRTCPMLPARLALACRIRPVRLVLPTSSFFFLVTCHMGANRETRGPWSVGSVDPESCDRWRGRPLRPCPRANFSFNVGDSRRSVAT